LGAGAIVLASQLTGGRATAQSKEELDKARATFLEGVTLAAANNCAAALGKYQAVAKVKMTAQVAFNIAECQERLGKLVSALGSYRLAASLIADSKPSEVSTQVGDRISSLEVRVPRLVIQRTEQTSKIELDGVEIGSSQLGQENFVDPGTHVVSGKIGETEVWRESVTLAEKENKTVVVKIDIAKFKPPSTATAAPTAAPTDTATAPSSTAEPRSKAPGFVVGGVGVVALGVGFGLMGASLGTAAELEKACDANKVCPASEEGKYNSGRTLAGVSTGLLIAGAVGIATGVVLLVRASGGDKPQPTGSAAGNTSSSRFVAPSAPPAEVGVAVTGGAGSGGLSLVGRF
jgi:hypothetical protein